MANESLRRAAFGRVRVLRIEYAVGSGTTCVEAVQRADAGRANIDRQHDVVRCDTVVRRCRLAVEAERRERRIGQGVIPVHLSVSLVVVAYVEGNATRQAATLDLRLEHDIGVLEVDFAGAA